MGGWLQSWRIRNARTVSLIQQVAVRIGHGIVAASKATPSAKVSATSAMETG
jgi:hypothetical protein